MNIMTKRGTQDNIVTYEHMCDTMADLQNIDPKFITLGSIALVLKGETGVEFYIANSEKEWTPIISGGTEGSFSPDITDPQDGDTLVYDGDTGVWINSAGGSSGGGGVFEVHMPNGWTSTETFEQIKAAVYAGKLVYLVEDSGTVGGDYASARTILTKIEEQGYEGGGGYYTVYFGGQYYYANSIDDYIHLPD